MDNKELEKRLNKVEADTDDNIKFLQMVRDGDPHKRWMMWINSMQREKPYILS